MTEAATFSWGHAALRVDFLVDAQRSARIVDSAAEQTLPIPHLKGGEADISVLFPQHAKSAVEWRAGRGELTVHLPEGGTACLIAIARA